MVPNKRRPLGRTGFNVFPLGLGGHTYPVGNTPLDFRTPEQRARLISFLVSAGVNYFDTTWMNEVELLADSFARAGVKMEDVVVSMQYVDGISDPRMRENLEREIEARLRVFDCPQAPLFILGVGNSSVTYGDIVQAVECLERFKGKKLVRNIGVSCHSLEHYGDIRRLMEETDLIDYMMIRYNHKHRDADQGLFQTARDHDVGIVVMKAFCWDCGPGNWGRRISVFENAEVSAKASEACKGMNVAQEHLAWSIRHSGCSTTAVSMNTLEEAEENLAAMALLDEPVDGGSFPRFENRLYDPTELGKIAATSESRVIRERAAKILHDEFGRPV